jgi:hypothetical protein
MSSTIRPIRRGDRNWGDLEIVARMNGRRPLEQAAYWNNAVIAHPRRDRPQFEAPLPSMFRENRVDSPRNIPAAGFSSPASGGGFSPVLDHQDAHNLSPTFSAGRAPFRPTNAGYGTPQSSLPGSVYGSPARSNASSPSGFDNLPRDPLPTVNQGLGPSRNGSPANPHGFEPIEPAPRSVTPLPTIIAQQPISPTVLGRLPLPYGYKLPHDWYQNPPAPSATPSPPPSPDIFSITRL